MKKLWVKNIFVLAMTLTLVFTFVSCSSNDSSNAEPTMPAYEEYAYDNAAEASGAMMTETAEESYADSDSAAATGGAQSSTLMAPENRKIIYTGTINMETEHFDQAITNLSLSLTQAGGYISSTYTEQYSYDDLRYASYTLRLPVDKYRQFIETINETGNVTMFEEHTEDVTLQYVDIESRLVSLRTQEQNLLSMLEEAQDIETSIIIYDTLSDVQYEIESYTAQQRTLNDLIDYCTIHLYIYEVEIYTPTNESYFAKLATAIQGSAQNFVTSMGYFVIDIIYIIPQLIILAIIALIVFLTVKKSINKKRQKQQKIMQEQNMHQNNTNTYMPMNQNTNGRQQTTQQLQQQTEENETTE